MKETLDDRVCVILCQDQIEEIANLAAERAAHRAVELIKDDAYKTIGKAIIDKTFVVIGIVSMGIWAFLESKDLFNFK